MEQLQHSDPKLIGPYTVMARLGSGGMGIVYLCTSPGGHRLAVKVIRPELAGDAHFRARFRREVATAKLVRSHVTAAVVDADTESPTPWLATIFLDGPTLTAEVERSPLAEHELRRLAAALAEALQFIHGAGLVHRDLKPSNIILASDGPRVIDFGIAQAAEATALTAANLRLGSPWYMAPEQIRSDAIGPESDIFALGAVLAYAATGRPPFGTGATDVVLYRVLHEEPNLDDVPPGLHSLVAACLAKDPRQRPTPDDILTGTTGYPETQALAQSFDGVTRAESRTLTLPDGLAATRVETRIAEKVHGQSAPHPHPPHASIREAERRISALDDATQLDLSNLELTDSDLRALRSTLSNLADLTELALFGNKLTAVPEAVFSLTGLTELWLHDNQLVVVPDAIGNLTHLTGLSLQGNTLSAIPEGIGNLTALARLLLSDNQLSAVPEAIGRLTALTHLYLHDNQLVAVPESIGNLTALTTFSLHNNQLSTIPQAIGCLSALNHLYLHDNQLVAMPDAIGNLTELTTLSAHNNQLTAVPEAIGKLSALTILRLSGNQLTAVPEAIWNLTGLITFNLSHNQLKAVPDAIGNLTAVTTLNLSGNQLSEVPEAIGNLSALTELMLDGNKLSAVPEAIGNLTALTGLLLHDNQLIDVPPAIGNLTALTGLSLHDNQLGLVPESIGNLTALTEFLLNDNQLSVLPEAIGNLTALTTLSLQDNQLNVLPEAIGYLTALTHLYLHDNQLSVLPESVGNLIDLTTLSLYGNQMSAVPDSVGNLVPATPPSQLPPSADPDEERRENGWDEGFRGFGDDVIQYVEPLKGVFPVHITSSDAMEHFAVWALSATLEPVEVLVNTAGAYIGVRIAGLQGTTGGFRIKACGPWSLRLMACNELPVLRQHHSGVTDEVVFLAANLSFLPSATIARIVGAGEGNIIVWAQGEVATLLVNAIGPYEGTVLIPAGSQYLTIKAEATWSIDC